MDKTELTEAKKQVLDLIRRAKGADTGGEASGYANAALAAAQALNVVAIEPITFVEVKPDPVDPHRRPCWYRERTDAPYGVWLQGWLLKVCGDEGDLLIETESGELTWRAPRGVRFQPPEAD